MCACAHAHTRAPASVCVRPAGRVLTAGIKQRFYKIEQSLSFPVRVNRRIRVIGSPVCRGAAKSCSRVPLGPPPAYAANDHSMQHVISLLKLVQHFVMRFHAVVERQLCSERADAAHSINLLFIVLVMSIVVFFLSSKKKNIEQKNKKDEKMRRSRPQTGMQCHRDYATWQRIKMYQETFYEIEKTQHTEYRSYTSLIALNRSQLDFCEVSRTNSPRVRHAEENYSVFL